MGKGPGLGLANELLLANKISYSVIDAELNATSFKG